MAFFTYGFPFSYIPWILTLIVGFGAGFFLLSALAVGVFIILYMLDMIRIMPLLERFEKIASFFFANDIENAKEHIKKTYTIDVPDSVKKHGSPLIYVWIPHGLFCTSLFYHSISPHTDMPTELKPISPVIHHRTRYIPFASEIFSHYNIIYSDYDSMRKALKEGKSLSLALGGVREIAENSESSITCTIGNRSGVYRLAQETGASIVPVITYGENALFRLSVHPIVEKINAFCGRYGLVIPVPSWESVCNCIWGSRTPDVHSVHTVMGDPIHIEAGETVTMARERFHQALHTLYDKTRPDIYETDINIV